MHLRPRRSVLRAATAVTVIALPLSMTSAATAEPSPTAQLQLAKKIQAPNVERHLKAFQAIADANDGNRASGTAGYKASRDYVAGQLKKAGYNVTIQPFQFPFFQDHGGSELARTAPSAKEYTPTPPDGSTIGDFAVMTYSGSGEAAGTVQPVDVQVPPGEPNTSTSGCEEADFAGFTAGNIALMQRGTCTFEEKAANAQTAGASAAIIFNEGQEGRADTLQGTLGTPSFTIPVVGTSYAVGAELNAAGTAVRVKTDTESEERTTWNVLAESKKGDPNKVVMAGSHLDSVLAGPGINDNGSGSAAILETAVQLAKLPPKNKLRFAWWGAEELGLLGSEYYVANLSADEQAKLKLYLNFDMVASTNYTFGIYDGDDSDGVGEPAGPPGSAEIEKTFEKYYDLLKVNHVGTDFSGRSDYGPFILAGIPAGGLFTGAEGIKTEAEAKLFGGTAGEAYDPCYHAKCDDITNYDKKALKINTGAVAFAMLTYSYSKNLPGGTAERSTARTQSVEADHGHDHGGLVS